MSPDDKEPVQYSQCGALDPGGTSPRVNVAGLGSIVTLSGSGAHADPACIRGGSPQLENGSDRGGNRLMMPGA